MPPILRFEETLFAGGIWDSGQLGSLELVVGEVNSIGQESRFLHCIPYKFARLFRRHEELG